jgi:hypothetical protein
VQRIYSHASTPAIGLEAPDGCGGFAPFPNMYDNYDHPICNRGITTDSEAVPEMQHMFPFLPGTAPEGDAAIHRVADGVRPKLGPA